MATKKPNLSRRKANVSINRNGLIIEVPDIPAVDAGVVAAELVQVMRFAVDVRAQVEHIGRATLLVWHDRADRRAVDAGHGLEHIARDRHQGAGIAGRHAGIGAAVLDQFDRHAHRRILFLAQGDFDRVVHRHDLAGGDDAAARPVPCTLQRVRSAHEQQLRVGMGVEEGLAGRQRDLALIVASRSHFEGGGGGDKCD